MSQFDLEQMIEFVEYAEQLDHMGRWRLWAFSQILMSRKTRRFLGIGTAVIVLAGILAVVASYRDPVVTVIAITAGIILGFIAAILLFWG